MAFVKGQSGNPAGRPKGTPTKFSMALKTMILTALDTAGGVEYLAKQAVENPGPFMALVGKVLPTTLQGDADAPLAVTVITRRIVDPAGDRTAAGDS